MTLKNPNWNMDTGASSHLMDNTSKHAKLPFYNSESSVDYMFEIIHSDIWTSPIPSGSGIKYYAIFLDHFSYFVWVYPLHKKSDLFDNFIAFRAYVNKQFNVDIKALQCDHSDGSLSRYKARLVANEHSQQQDIDCDETFSLVVKPATICTVLSLAVSRNWPIHQLDVKNAFLYGHLSETVYMHQPSGFVDPNKPDYVCHLQRSLYVLKQASRAWFQSFASYATRVGFQHSKTDSSFFVFHRGSNIAYLLLYVDDIILTASLTGALQYLTFTRSDLSYGVQQLHVSSTTQLSAYTDADWAGCLVTRRSTSGYCVFLGDNLLSWSGKCQVTLSRSSVEAEYRRVANVVAENAWIRNLLCELHTPLYTVILVYCDNVSVSICL
uniref:Ribonuclease H-like domain-containing protein n=1 Tax=Tanacetum cinerariifolium TaxID=118510 RepID=A0A699HSC8_TANCI|nr:ribonuclease H-like domain-containing protein [Tanacetum cinerariifolium]